MSFTKFKDYPFTLENSQKTGLSCMEATFNSDLLETFTDFQISTHGKWKIDLFLNRISLNFENRWTRTTIPFRLKILSLNKFQNSASCPCELLFWSPRLNNNSCQDYNNTLFNKTTQMWNVSLTYQLPRTLKLISVLQLIYSCSKPQEMVSVRGACDC